SCVAVSSPSFSLAPVHQDLPPSSSTALHGPHSTSERARTDGGLLAMVLVPLQGVLEEADDQPVERFLLALGPASPSFLQMGRHADLEVDDGFRHRLSLRSRSIRDPYDPEVLEAFSRIPTIKVLSDVLS